MCAEKLYFFKGKEEVLTKPGKEPESENPTAKIKDSFNKVLDGKNLSFLLGSGCSSYVVKVENSDTCTDLGIPTMVPLAKDFYSSTLNQDTRAWLKDEIKLDVEAGEFKTNLESFLGTLHSIYFFYESTGRRTSKTLLKYPTSSNKQEIFC